MGLSGSTVLNATQKKGRIAVMHMMTNGWERQKVIVSIRKYKIIPVEFALFGVALLYNYYEK